MNKIGDFSCCISNNVVSFPGILNGIKGSVFLQCKMKCRWCEQIDPYSDLYMWGNIDGIPVSLLHVYLKNSDYIGGEDSISVIFDPSEVLIGRCCSEGIQATCISAVIPELNYMFSSPPLQSTHSFSTDDPSVLEYTFPDMIKADDKYGRLRIYQTFGENWTISGTSYKFLPVIEYQFERPLEIMDAVEKIAAVKNLFTFFANYYLPFGNIKLKSAESESEEHQKPYDCVLYLNHTESIPTLDKPFLIRSDTFSENFEEIWKRWLQIYEEAAYIPTLFYEIICNRSTRVNRFLNLSQAIEVYSNRYRKDDVERVARMKERTGEGKKPLIHLKHRFEDVFLLINPYLEIKEDKIPVAAKSLADMRNFFTHYDTKKYVEPSYQEMFAACHILEFILLAITYHEIGIPGERIKIIKKRVEFKRLNEFIDMLTRKYLKTPER